MPGRIVEVRKHVVLFHVPRDSLVASSKTMRIGVVERSSPLLLDLRLTLVGGIVAKQIQNLVI